MENEFTTMQSTNRDNPVQKNTLKYWSTEEEKELVLNFKSTKGDLKAIAARHGRTQRAIDMRLTKIIKDMKNDNIKASDVFQLFGGHMTKENFNERWDSPTITPPSSGTSQNSTQTINLLLKYMTDAEEKIQRIEQRVAVIESQLKPLIKHYKKNKMNPTIKP
jgi:hypothetical protein